MRNGFLVLCLLGVVLQAGVAWRAAAQEQTKVFADPWTLRKHYTISLRDAALDYAEDRAEFRGRSHGEIFLSNNTFSIVLGDGRTLTADDFDGGVSSRENFESDYGDGAHYSLAFPPAHGLKVSHRLTRFRSRAFALVEFAVENTGDTPVVIRELNPLVISDGGLNLGPGAKLTSLPLTGRGGFLLYAPEATPLFTYLTDSGLKTGLALGILPEGRAQAGVELKPVGDAWEGRVHNSFVPGHRLAPGEKLEADTTWISYGVPVFDEVNVYFAWTCSTSPLSKPDRPKPKGWVSVAEGRGAAELTQAAQAAGIRFALLPAGHQDNAGGTARQLRGADLVPGITIDPMALAGGEAAWNVAADGKSWLNLTQEPARAFVAQKVQALHKSGFEFFVVAKSAVPDAALEQIGLGRAAADTLALEVVLAAAGPVPVFPAAAGPAEVTSLPLAGHQALLKPFCDYLAPFGPARLSFGDGKVSQEVLTALQDWPGPLETIGAPPQSVRGVLRDVVQPTR